MKTGWDNRYRLPQRWDARRDPDPRSYGKDKTGHPACFRIRSLQKGGLLPYPAQDLSQYLSSALTATSTSMVVVAVTVAFTLDHPEQPLRLMEEPPELADVHVCPAFFSTTTTPSIQSYQTSREKLLVLPNPV